MRYHLYETDLMKLMGAYDTLEEAIALARRFYEGWRNTEHENAVEEDFVIGWTEDDGRTHHNLGGKALIEAIGGGEVAYSTHHSN